MSTVTVNHEAFQPTNPASNSHATTPASQTEAEATTSTPYMARTEQPCLLEPPGQRDDAANPPPTTTTTTTTTARDFTTRQWPLAYPREYFSTVFPNPPLYSLSADELASALDYAATQPLPDTERLFPWLHGLNPRNLQLMSYFLPGRRTPLSEPPEIIRQVLIVKTGGNLEKSVLRGAVSPNEVLASSGIRFLPTDLATGLSVRNFGIQTAKLAVCSDIVVYGDDDTPDEDVFMLACRLSDAQARWARQGNLNGGNRRRFNTFILSESFEQLQQVRPEIVAIDSAGALVGDIVDFGHLEKLEMCKMNKLTEITNSVWHGSTYNKDLNAEDQDCQFDVSIGASDRAKIPDPSQFKDITDMIRANQKAEILFPSAGVLQSSTVSNQPELCNFISMLKWMYQATNPGILINSRTDHRPLKILIHCRDGHTEASLLCMAYVMFSEGLRLHEALLKLHCEKKRELFIYPTDFTILRDLECKILEESSTRAPSNSTHMHRETGVRVSPPGVNRLNMNLPSRITSYMYLGNIEHANEPTLLHALGIGRILSVGESVSWSDTTHELWGERNLLQINLHDNGMDSLIPKFGRCLDFIDQGKRSGTATLVHCRVGVSRSASICIAEVMASMDLSFVDAYCMVRARRLNVVIQPNLRFVYELMVWEETLQRMRGQPVRRKLEWATVAREIARLNRGCT